MRTIETFIDIAAPPARVWQVLKDFAEYSEWNPFLTSIRGQLRVGEKLKVRIEPPGKPGMNFNPTIMVVQSQCELRWKGKVVVSGLLDGEHYFQLERSGVGTRFHQGERFTGLLVPLLSGTFAATEQGFNAMNRRLKERAEV